VTTTAERQETPAVQAPAPNRRTVNQTICAVSYLDEDIAAFVADELDSPCRGGAPAATEDPVAALRHAVLARRLHFLRDVACLLIFAVTAGAVITQLAERFGLARAVPIFVLALVAYLSRRRLSRWSVQKWRKSWGRRRVRAIAWLAGLALGVAIVLILLLRSPLLWECAGTVLLGVAAGWTVMVGTALHALRRAAAVVAEDAPDPRSLAPRLGRRREQHAESLQSANVVVYGESRTTNPFVGNGLSYESKKITVDVGQHLPDCDAEPVEVLSLHEWLQSRFLGETVADGGQLTAGHRLYADGRRVPWSSSLMAAGRPVSRMGWDDLAEEIRHPERADDRRVYFYLQEICRGGELGVSIFVRPLLQGNELSIEFSPLLIAPLFPDVEELVNALPRRFRDQVGRAVRASTSHAPAMVLGSPLLCALRVIAWAARLSERGRWRLAARFGWRYDAGADISVREFLSWEDHKNFDHFVVQDVIRIQNYLSSLLVTTIAGYLRAHGIDTNQLSTEARITNIQHWTVGSVRANTVGFGSNHTFGGGKGDEK